MKIELSAASFEAIKLAKEFESTREEKENSFSLNRTINSDNIVFKAVNDNYLRINQGYNNENKNVLVCCTGDDKSMALLTCIGNIFGSANTNVLLINHHKNRSLVNFLFF